MKKILEKIGLRESVTCDDGDSSSWVSWAIDNPDLLADIAYVESVAPEGEKKTPHKISRVNRNLTESMLLKERHKFLQEPESFIRSIEFFDSLVMLCLEREGYRAKMHLAGEEGFRFDILGIKGFLRSDGRLDLMACHVSEGSMTLDEARDFKTKLESIEKDPEGFIKREFSVSNHPIKAAALRARVFCRDHVPPEVEKELLDYGGGFGIEHYSGRGFIDWVTGKF